jgi:outer membrane lipoprotein-sorting protein
MNAGILQLTYLSNIKTTAMMLNRITLTAILLAIVPMAAIGQDAKEILRRMEYNMRGEASYSEMTMETVRPRYTREISMRSWTLGDDYALIYVTAPARDQGTAFLKRGNEIWNFVPNIDRTVRMPPSMMSQSWMGSDFSNDDLVRGVSVIDDYDHKLMGSETVDGLESYRIEMIPHPETPVVYDKVIYWVSKEYYLPVRVENYDEYGDLISTIHFRDIKTIGGRPMPSVMEMVPEDKRGHKTVIRYHDADFGADISEGFFSIQNLTTIR